MVKEPENSDRDALFKKFEATFESNFFATYERDEVGIDEEERSKLFDKYLTRADYPTLNELKEIVIFQTAKARERYGTDAVSLNYFFNDDLEKAFKCAIRPLRFYVGYVKPEMEGEEETSEAAPVPKEPSPEKKILRRYEAAKIAGVVPETISRWAREPDSFPVIWNKGETHIKGIPKETFLEYLKGKTKNQS